MNVVFALVAAVDPTTLPAVVNQSALNPAGAQASHFSALWWPTFWMLAVVYVLVLIFTFIPMLRRRIASERSLTVSVSAGVIVSVIILFVVLIGDFITSNRVRAASREETALTIKITGHQWWWEITYTNAEANKTISDANELHLPAGKNVRIDLQSNDVIHSFWVPNLAGKKDLVPGHTTSIWLNDNHVGTYWGQCAEFCGYQHAHMRFAVVVQAQDDFDRWLASARLPANKPFNAEQFRGQNVFLSHTCSMCHTITGTEAGGRLGPDLTHIASRLTIAGGSLPNSMGHLGGWIIDPQGIKPGVIMPQHALSGDDLQALLEYLENLK